MPPVFNRDDLDPHPYDAAIAQWLRSTETLRAMARNVMHDYRVSSDRERTFDSYTQSPRTALALEDGILDYKRERVQMSPTPDFIVPSINGNNIPTVRASGRPHKDVMLLRLLDFNGLKIVYRWGRDRKWTVFANLPPGNPSNNEFQRWLDDKLLGKSDLEIRTFVGHTLSLMNAYLLNVGPHNPVWVTTWEEFRPHVSGGPDRWLEVLGVTKRDSPRWLLLLGYRVREAGTIIRPTMLDAGWYPFHFPSPPLPAGNPNFHGHPMDLRSTAKATHLVTEFIHVQIEHRLEHWLNTVSDGKGVGQIGRTTQATPDTLGAQRANHHDLLLANYGPAVRSWMPRAV